MNHDTPLPPIGRLEPGSASPPLHRDAGRGKLDPSPGGDQKLVTPDSGATYRRRFVHRHEGSAPESAGALASGGSRND